MDDRDRGSYDFRSHTESGGQQQARKEWLAQNTVSYPVGAHVSIGVTPENIQIMNKPQSEDEEAMALDE